MRHVRAGGRSGGEVWKQQDRYPSDDWFGDMSDDDWSEETVRLPDRGQSTSAPSEPHMAARRSGRRTSGAGPAQARGNAGVGTSRSTAYRRRVAAVLVGILAIGLGVAAAVLLSRDGAEPTATSTTSTTGSETVSTPAGTQTDPTSPTTTSTTPTTPTTTTPEESVTSFTLPAGTKLQRGESVGESDLAVSTDPELIADLQRALAAAGFAPGSPDGTFGLQTEAAVVAFQQANGLPPDGIVGPETATALNNAIAGG